MSWYAKKKGKRRRRTEKRKKLRLQEIAAAADQIGLKKLNDQPELGLHIGLQLRVHGLKVL